MFDLASARGRSAPGRLGHDCPRLPDSMGHCTPSSRSCDRTATSENVVVGSSTSMSENVDPRCRQEDRSGEDPQNSAIGDRLAKHTTDPVTPRAAVGTARSTDPAGVQGADAEREERGQTRLRGTGRRARPATGESKVWVSGFTGLLPGRLGVPARGCGEDQRPRPTLPSRWRRRPVPCASAAT